MDQQIVDIPPKIDTQVNRVYLPLITDAASQKFAAWQNVNATRIAELEESYRLEELSNQSIILSKRLQVEIFADLWEEARAPWEKLLDSDPNNRPPPATQ